MRMNESVTGRLYDLWSAFYDHTFGALVHRRQHRALDQFHFEPGDRVLDLGAGTGMTLPHYPDDVTVVAVDLSEGMLRKAQTRCREQNLTNCHLAIADALHPPLAERSFDHILISHTVSVVSKPARLMQWAARLIKPGGRVVVLNHFRSPNPMVGWFEKVLNPLFVKIGWRSDLTFEESMRGVNLEVEYAFHLSMGDIWKIVVLKAPVEGQPSTAPPTPHPPVTPSVSASG
ncbi:MAG: class I SAM-dependent methyltransferase [Phycisphaeraceae bacterium]|nr:class I SAM-dependent methyltransferase [Phycisphaeraceae bacterium]